MMKIWDGVKEDTWTTIDEFHGKICPVMSGYQSRPGKTLTTLWVGVECLYEKCQWYGTKCDKVKDNKLY